MLPVSLCCYRVDGFEGFALAADLEKDGNVCCPRDCVVGVWMDGMVLLSHLVWRRTAKEATDLI